MLVVTGGAVRLTGSGLGCPTWPRCTESSFTPHGALDVHAAIEFGNRMLTFVLVAVAVATFVAAWGSPRRDVRVLAFVLALGIPAQAIIGGFTVLTDLNPWVVSFHLLCSLAIIGLSVLFLHRLSHPAPSSVVRGPALVLAWLTFGSAWVVLYLGTVVTGSGPHAGDEDAARNGLDPVQVSQLHADSVFLFLGLSIGLYFTVRSVGLPPAGCGAAGRDRGPGRDRLRPVLHRPPVVLVGVHMLGAALGSAAVTWVLLSVREPAVATVAEVSRGSGEPGHRCFCAPTRCQAHRCLGAEAGDGGEPAPSRRRRRCQAHRRPGPVPSPHVDLLSHDVIYRYVGWPGAHHGSLGGSPGRCRRCHRNPARGDPDPRLLARPRGQPSGCWRVTSCGSIHGLGSTATGSLTKPTD